MLKIKEDFSYFLVHGLIIVFIMLSFRKIYLIYIFNDKNPNPHSLGVNWVNSKLRNFQIVPMNGVKHKSSPKPNTQRMCSIP